MRVEKKYIVEELLDKTRDANPLVFTDYSKVKAQKINELRMQLRSVDSRLQVVQNRLFQRVLDETGLGNKVSKLKGPVAVAYGGKDVVEVVKILLKFLKDNPKTIDVKSGFVDGQYLELDKLEELSKLPSKDVLLAKLVGQVAAPLSRMVMVLQGNLRKLVCVLEAVKDKKSDSKG